MRPRDASLRMTRLVGGWGEQGTARTTADLCGMTIKGQATATTKCGDPFYCVAHKVPQSPASACDSPMPNLMILNAGAAPFAGTYAMPPHQCGSSPIFASIRWNRASCRRDSNNGSDAIPITLESFCATRASRSRTASSLRCKAASTSAMK
jgi:hypothetical protein